MDDKGLLVAVVTNFRNCTVFLVPSAALFFYLPGAALGLVKKGENESQDIDSVYKGITEEELRTQHHDVFQGLDKFTDPYHIQIVDSEQVKPVIHAPRCVPLSLHDRLREQLNTVEKNGIITNVDGPTDRVNSLVAVERKDGSI